MHLNYLANIGRYIPEILLVILMVGLILLETTYKEDEKNRNAIDKIPIASLEFLRKFLILFISYSVIIL